MSEYINSLKEKFPLQIIYLFNFSGSHQGPGESAVPSNHAKQFSLDVTIADSTQGQVCNKIFLFT